MQLLADIMKKMNSKNLISKSDLYKYSEKEIIEKIENCHEDNISNCFNAWKNATQINESDIMPQGKYFVSVEKLKIRYINPLVRYGNEYVRVIEISDKAREDIESTLHAKTKKYAYLDFEF